MANIKSQIKRNKTNEKARLRNKATKSSLKTAVKKFRTAADAGDQEEITQTARSALTELDKAASKGIIHKNQAANRKSAMAKSIHKASAGAPGTASSSAHDRGARPARGSTPLSRRRRLTAGARAAPIGRRPSRARRQGRRRRRSP